jgi:hypothetical protein
MKKEKVHNNCSRIEILSDSYELNKTQKQMPGLQETLKLVNAFGYDLLPNMSVSPQSYSSFRAKESS